MSSIRDYALIGDCRSAALVSRSGSIDWLCWPRFDSPSTFAALLHDEAGRFRIGPTSPFTSSRRYVGDTNVLEMRLQTEGGTIKLTDLMPVASEAEKRRLLVPDHEVLRLVECERGEAEVELLFEPRPRYGAERPRFHRAGPMGLRVDTSTGTLYLRSDLPLEVDGDTVRARERLRAGETRQASLTFAAEWPAVLPPLGDRAREALERTVRWWEAWAAQVQYAGPQRDAVVRSALVLKLLTYSPSGAVIAAPTTSLPEAMGGALNWDYRFCWLRDASMTVRALFGLGLREEATAFVDWLLHATRLSQPELRILYDVYGNEPPPERELTHLDGHGGSRPVRIGNAAAGQRQLDVYGEVIDAAYHLARRGWRPDRETQHMLGAFGEHVCRHWQEPDEGIWEPRSGRAHHTHSRLLSWTALDRLLQLYDRGYLQRLPVNRIAMNRDMIRREIEERAWNDSLGSYVSELDGDGLDASLLLFAWYGFEDAAGPRMKQTYARIRASLGAGEALLYRYRGDESPGEGAFGICGFWAAELVALGAGRKEEADRLFQVLCGYGNDVGLYAEEVDPATGDPLGNFPQAFTHIGLINAAISLDRRWRDEAGPEPRARVPSSSISMQEARS